MQKCLLFSTNKSLYVCTELKTRTCHAIIGRNNGRVELRTQLLIFVRYAIKVSIRNELQLNNEFRTTTRGEDVFELLEDFFKKNGLQWNKLIGCTTDGAPVMLSRKSEFQVHAKALSPHLSFPFTASCTNSFSLLNFYLLI